jgi:hypothetical protein
MEKRPWFLDLIVEIDGVSYPRAKQVLEEFKIGDEEDLYVDDYKERPEKIVLPPNTFYINSNLPLPQRFGAAAYLLGRGFGESVMDKYRLCFCTDGDYGYRIIIPIYFKGKLVSYLGRDFTGRQEPRYKNCKSHESLLRNRELLYGYDNFKGGAAGHGYLVEGCTDVWRIGDLALATLTNKLYNSQRHIIIGFNLDSLTIAFDPGSYSKGLEAGEELSPFIPKIKVLNFQDDRDVAEHKFEEILRIEENTRYSVF